ncbi:MAG: hypothetical protein JW862_12915, partial [Anaerolineales bacterium]|nr:hypothetical protein [Anaerolineales bacterium]
YYPDMLDWVTEEIAALVAEGRPPGEIAVLVPYLGDALRYALVERLNRLGVATRSHRPSRSLREEPATLCLLTLAKLAHPQWGLEPTRFDVAYALLYSLAGLDLVRAQLLAQQVFRPQAQDMLLPFDSIPDEMQQRITFRFGEEYDRLFVWLQVYRAHPPLELDHFLGRLFGEVLSQPGFGFHADYNAATVAANLVESVQKFRWATAGALAAEGVELGKEYLEMVADGVIAAQYLLPWHNAVEDAVFLAPAYTFLMRNQPVDVQFWLDVGGRGWYERLSQPLTHPHVLSRDWELGLPWTAAEEMATGRAALQSLVLGLTRRCRHKIYLGLSELNEQGYEQKGELLRAIDRAMPRQSREAQQ